MMRTGVSHTHVGKFVRGLYDPTKERQIGSGKSAHTRHGSLWRLQLFLKLLWVGARSETGPKHLNLKGGRNGKCNITLCLDGAKRREERGEDSGGGGCDMASLPLFPSSFIRRLLICSDAV